MSESTNGADRRERLLGRTLEARKGWAKLESMRPRQEGRREGEIYVLEACAAYPVEWALVEANDAGRRWLVVPLDDQPLVGSTDLAIPPPDDTEEDPSVRGPASLRIGQALEIDAQAISRGRWTGRLPTGVAEATREMRRRLDEGRFAGSVLGREVDRDPDYRAWIEDVVEPAREILRDSIASDLEAAQEATASTGSTDRSRWWPLAAAALLALGAGLAWELFRLREQRADLVAALEVARERDAEAAQRAAEQRTGWEAERDELLRRLAKVEPDLESPAALEALVDLPLAVFAISATRGEPEVVEVSAQDEWLALVVQLDGTIRGSEIGGLEIRRLADNAVQWSRSWTGSEPTDRGLISILLPSRMLPPGAYRLRLVGRGEADRILATFSLVVERP